MAPVVPPALGLDHAIYRAELIFLRVEATSHHAISKHYQAGHNIRRRRIGFEIVRDVLHGIHEPRKFEAAGFADFRATTISDAIALSTTLSVAGLAVLIDTVSSLALGAL
jgi:hypothetical protein